MNTKELWAGIAAFLVIPLGFFVGSALGREMVTWLAKEMDMPFPPAAVTTLTFAPGVFLAVVLFALVLGIYGMFSTR